MDGHAFTNSVSLIFNKVFQEQQLSKLHKSLMNDQNNVLATILSERLKNSFGLRALPSLDDALPFIHFDESGQTHFTLIYTSSLLSPFALICSHYFGRHLMNLQRDVYNLLYTNTLNISDTETSDDEIVADIPPPPLSYANGKARDRMQGTSKSITSDGEGSSCVRVDEGAEEENSSESLQTFSMSSLLTPALLLTAGITSSSRQHEQQLLQESSESNGIDLAGNLKQQQHHHHQQDSGSLSPFDSTIAKVQLSKKYRCDRCSKSFSVRSHLDSHRVTHTGEKKYECKRCGNRFTQSSSLRNHMIAIHTRQFPHVCGLCNKGFLLPSQLRKHREVSHTKST